MLRYLLKNTLKILFTVYRQKVTVKKGRTVYRQKLPSCCVTVPSKSAKNIVTEHLPGYFVLATLKVERHHNSFVLQVVWR